MKNIIDQTKYLLFLLYCFVDFIIGIALLIIVVIVVVVSCVGRHWDEKIVSSIV